VSDDFWTPEENAEFAQAELDDVAAEQAAEDQFPEGWTEVGATAEPIQLRGGIVAGPARLYTQPVESPIFEAIDRASEDRTPVIESTTDLGSFARMLESLTESLTSFTETVRTSIATAEGPMDKLAALEQIYGPLTHQRRQVALIGTGKRRHVHPGPRFSSAKRGLAMVSLSRAEHARRRRLYTERLRRDRRRIRKGRAPILRSSTFERLIPNAQVNVTKVGPEYCGMEIVAHPGVPDDQVYVVDPSILDGYRFIEPKTFLQDPERPRSRFADQVALYMSTWARYGSPTGRTRTTSYFTQMLHDERHGLLTNGNGWSGPVVIAIDETADWAPEHPSDVDRWINEGGADRG
jgi:hypothetical protein